MSSIKTKRLSQFDVWYFEMSHFTVVSTEKLSLSRSLSLYMCVCVYVCVCVGTYILKNMKVITKKFCDWYWQNFPFYQNEWKLSYFERYYRFQACTSHWNRGISTQLLGQIKLLWIISFDTLWFAVVYGRYNCFRAIFTRSEIRIASTFATVQGTYLCLFRPTILSSFLPYPPLYVWNN